MAERHVQRRLAAIFAADIAWYSPLMREDEEGKLAALTIHRNDLTQPFIAEHWGRIVNTAVDGLRLRLNPRNREPLAPPDALDTLPCMT